MTFISNTNIDNKENKHKYGEYNKVLLKDNKSEIKHLERQILEYDAVGWDMAYIMFKQDEIHEHYREKEKGIGIDIC